MPNPQADYLMYLMSQGLLTPRPGVAVGMNQPVPFPATQGAPYGQSGGPSTGLGAPAPSTRHGDTLRSVNPQGQRPPTPPGGYPGPQYAGPGYGSPQPGLGTGDPGLGVGRTQLTPNPPSPGLGYGAPMPTQNEDGSFGNAGQDPLLLLLAAYLNQRGM